MEKVSTEESEKGKKGRLYNQELVQFVKYQLNNLIQDTHTTQVTHNPALHPASIKAKINTYKQGEKGPPSYHSSI